MKKRLLSAALALAMVLTLLPATVFAAAPTAEPTSTDPGRAAVQYVSGTDYSKPTETANSSGEKFVKDCWTWQYKSTADSKNYWALGTTLNGIVTGTSASGTYYPTTSIIDATTGLLVSNSFTIVGNASITVNASALNGVSNSLSVNTFGGILAFGTGALEKVTSLTVTDTAGTKGTVSALSRDVSSYNAGTESTTKSTAGLVLRITDAKSSGIDLKGRGNQVYLTNVDLRGDIKLSGATTVTPVSGTPTTSVDGQTLTTNPMSAWPYTKSKVSSNITVVGNGSNVTLNGTAVSGTVGVTSTGGSFRVDNGTTTGVVTIASGDVNATDAPPPVTVNDGSVGGITYALGTNAKTAANITINAQGRATGKIDVASGTVSIHSANVSDIDLDQGTLNIDGTSGTAGAITLAASGGTTFNFSGTGWTITSLTKTAGNNLTIGSNWPTGRVNTITTLTLNDYTGQGIKGGVFGGAAVAQNRGWFAPDLQFARKFNSNYFALYGTRELAAAIADAGTAAATDGTIDVIGAAATKHVEFYNSMLDVNSNNPIAKVGYGKSTGIYLPDKVNGTAVATWTNLDNAKEYGVNEEVPISIAAVNDIKLVIQSAGAAVSRLQNVSASGPNQNVTASLNNNQIVLSGAVGQDSYEDITLTLTTDLIDNNGSPVTFQVLVSYNTTTKTSKFSTLGMNNPPLGVTVNSDNIVVGGNTYTLTTSSLAKPAANLKVAGISGTYGLTGFASITGKSVVPTVNVSGMGTVTRADLIAKLSKSEFDWTQSIAMQQVVNQAMATITASNTLDGYVTAAQRAAWTALGNRGKTPSESDLTGTGYKTAVLEPYLALNVTAYNPSGTMTATLVPSYRVIVVSDVPANMTALAGRNGFTAEGYYIAQQGRALNTPSTNLDYSLRKDASVTLRLGGSAAPDALPTGFQGTVMHQDGTYVYNASGASVQFTMLHGGKSGLGTIVINKTPALVSMLPAGKTTGTDDMYYDSLQAAIDDTRLSTSAGDVDKVTVTAAYGGSGVIDVTGEARTFEIETKGQTTITPANNNFTVGVGADGHTYTVQLTKSIAPAGQNIVVSSATGGSASVNANPASAGQTVTITLSPNAGYTSSGVTVKTASGQTVSVSGSGNTYTFVMPSGSVTVTPSFTASQTIRKATVSVSPNSMGTTTTTAAATNNQVDAGSNVGVTTNPASGYRTMGVNISTNGGAATAVRQGDNYFTFTVPANATAVTVTPIYDRDNGTKFSDVWSTEYYSNPVAWAVGRNITNGTSTYTFSPSVTCTRAQMMTFLWRAAGRPTVSGANNPFVDVYPSMGSDYYSAILWAVSKGITNGVDSTHFGPSQTVSRAQAVTFLYRYAGSPSASTYTGFTDAPSSEYYARAVSWANAKGITNGKTSTTFAPSWGVTRAEAVTFLYRHITGLTA